MLTGKYVDASASCPDPLRVRGGVSVSGSSGSIRVSGSDSVSSGGVSVSGCDSDSDSVSGGVSVHGSVDSSVSVSDSISVVSVSGGSSDSVSNLDACIFCNSSLSFNN